MNDSDIKAKINDSKTHSLHRAYGGRLYHSFPAGQEPRHEAAVCGFWPSYPIFDIGESMPYQLLSHYPLCKGCKEAFLKLEQ